MSQDAKSPFIVIEGICDTSFACPDPEVVCVYNMVEHSFERSYPGSLSESLNYNKRKY